jgi:hypothetical protein
MDELEGFSLELENLFYQEKDKRKRKPILSRKR